MVSIAAPSLSHMKVPADLGHMVYSRLTWCQITCLTMRDGPGECPPENSEGPACEVCILYQGNIFCSTEGNANVITESLQSLQRKEHLFSTIQDCGAGHSGSLCNGFSMLGSLASKQRYVRESRRPDEGSGVLRDP